MKFFRLIPEENDAEVITFTSPLVKPAEFSDPLLYDDGEPISLNLYSLKNNIRLININCIWLITTQTQNHRLITTMTNPGQS